jgi:hypothetical protein
MVPPHRKDRQREDQRYACLLAFNPFSSFLGQQSQIPIHPSNCLVTALKLDKGRKALLERKKRVAKEKNKHKEGAAAGLD